MSIRRSYGEGQFRFTNKSQRGCETSNYYNWFNEQINLYGQELTYYQYETI